MLRTIYAFNVAEWKRALIKKYFKSSIIIFLPLKDSVYQRQKIILRSPRSVFLVWGMKQPRDLQKFSNEFNVPIWRIEDGFIRSIGLGSGKSLPYSLCIDKNGIYFDSSKMSDLESILLETDFNKNKKFLEKAKWCLKEIRDSGISKYNETTSSLIAAFYGEKVAKRILVLGQVEDDQSLLYGCEQVVRNADLIQLAIEENPGAQIFYKSHPDYLSGNRRELSPIEKINGPFTLIPFKCSLKSSLLDVDKVYTLTSLGGFEALIHGVPVTTVGAPFYSGWGVTDDRYIITRRNRVLTVEEIFAAAYIMYPQYRDPISGQSIDICSVIERIKEEVEANEELTDTELLYQSYYYNMALKTDVEPEHIVRSKASNIAIVTDNIESISYAKALASVGKNISYLTTLDKISNDIKLLLTETESKSISISSVSKKYGVPLSEIERKAVKISADLSDSFKSALKNMDSGFYDGIIDAFGFDFEDYIYQEALRFIAADEVLKDCEAVIFILNDITARSDIINSFVYHASKINRKGDLYFQQDTRAGYKSIEEALGGEIKEEFDLRALKVALKDYIWRVRLGLRDNVKIDGQYAAVVGNLSKDNYAYSPAAVRVVKNIEKFEKNVILFHPSIGSDSVYDDSRQVAFDNEIHRNMLHYDGGNNVFVKSYPCVGEMNEQLTKFVFSYIIEILCNKFSKQYVGIFESRIKSYVAGLAAKMILSLEVERIVDNVSVLFTTIDRSFVSNIVGAHCGKRGVLRVGVQPQIISDSTRYRKPEVDVMGVIDSQQQQIFANKKFPIKNTFLIGSVNIADRLVRIEKFIRESRLSEKKSIFFVMQHSSEKVMLAISKALIRQVEEDVVIYIKPHPHQEISVLNKIRMLFSNKNNVVFMSADSDTYATMSHSDLVIGFFSSVLYEAILSGRKVLIGGFNDLNESVDFSMRGICLKATNENEFGEMIRRTLNDDSYYENIYRNLESYLELNTQFSNKNYYHSFDKFICSHLV